MIQSATWRATLAEILEARWEGLRVMALLPVLMFPSVRPILTVTLLGVWLVITALAWARGVPLWVRTPLNWPIFLLAGGVCVGGAVTPFSDLAAPKLASLVLGLLGLRAVVLTALTPGQLKRTVAFCLMLGCAVVAQGAVATAWFAKFAFLSRATAAMPQLVGHLPGTAPEGVQPNALAGTILLLLPLLVILLADALNSAVRRGQRSPDSCAERQWALGPLLVATLGLGVLLFLTQSRTAWMAMIVTAAILAAVRWQVARRVVGAVLLMGSLGLALGHGAMEAVVRRLTPPTSSLDLSWVGRVELWHRASTAVSDFPFTGLGLNAFRRVVHDLYPLTLSGPDFDVAHAHNVFLQTALDVGLPGLVAYIALLIVVSAMAWQVYRTAARSEGILALGLWGNLVAVHLFGLTDAVVLGAKVGLLLWLSIGLIAALHRRTVGINLMNTGLRRVG
jgi:putative inorganic carbon (HCO3(-)) transporter